MKNIAVDSEDSESPANMFVLTQENTLYFCDLSRHIATKISKGHSDVPEIWFHESRIGLLVDDGEDEKTIGFNRVFALYCKSKIASWLKGIENLSCHEKIVYSRYSSITSSCTASGLIQNEPLIISEPT